MVTDKSSEARDQAVFGYPKNRFAISAFNKPGNSSLESVA